jgi:hypothetical protein
LPRFDWLERWDRLDEDRPLLDARLVLRPDRERELVDFEFDADFELELLDFDRELPDREPDLARAMRFLPSLERSAFATPVPDPNRSMLLQARWRYG